MVNGEVVYQGYQPKWQAKTNVFSVSKHVKGRESKPGTAEVTSK
jgi:hypothetical protein